MQSTLLAGMSAGAAPVETVWRVLEKVKVKATQSCPSLCDPMAYAVHGILQARILAWVAFPFSRDLPDPGLNPGLPHCRRVLYQLISFRQ